MEDGRKVSMPFFKHVFSIALEAPKGDKIPYSKIVAFICWLRQQKFDIRLISRDQFQSEYLAQILEEQGFKVSKISLDRTPDGYMALRSVILEERINMLHCQLLEDELIELQRDSVTGKIDHKVGGSKDVADSFAGSIWNAILDNPEPTPSINKYMKSISAVNTSKSAQSAINSLFPTIKKY